MIIKDIRKKAKDLNVTVGKKKKADLIRDIQRAEKNNPCFLTGILECDQFGCCWREDCIK
ncbi:MAG: SAP domain-containing protein [Nanoarchaeota archaeon]|nr:SAP domain-containing protein [Nanoarchaeota archaeon]MBU1854258.1 SAP domain-containing protein [Nanoarchaeota archaeon]